tara:strand:- start:403 stop:594 length:192 start_codon:yes stop_codon:yes gene_type:complete
VKLYKKQKLLNIYKHIKKTKMEVIEKRFRTLASEIEKRGEMNGIIAELTSVILKEFKEAKQND